MNFLSGNKTRRSYLAAVGGIAAVGVVASMAAVVAPNLRADSNVAAAQQGIRAGDPGDKKDGGREHDEDFKDDDVKKVDCDADELISALVRANADKGGVLKLEEKCTYTLTAFKDDTGLPEIVQPITILGNGATIVRAANAERFRIFEVGLGGDLTLVDLTVKGGDADDEDGGGLLVEEGGKATVVDSKFTLNRADDGGAIANYGITKVKGDDFKDEKDKKDDPRKDEKDKKDDSRKDEDDKDKKDEHGKDEKDKKDDDHGFSKISRNTADNNGGAIYNAGLLTVEDTRISRNNAANFGGAIENNGGTALLKNVLLDHNFAEDDSGGIDSDSNGITKVKETKVSDNVSFNDGGGLGVFGGSSLYLEESKVVNNTAENNGGGVYVSSISQAAIDDSKINKNTVQDGFGGGIFSDGGDVVVRKSEVNENRAVDDDGAAGGINIEDDGDLTLTKSEVNENFAVNPPGGIRSESEDVEVDDETEIIKNRPTNCEGSPEEIPNCFG